MEKITDDGKVLKRILHEGTGNVVPMYAKCLVHYNAWLDLSDEPFDSSRMRGRKHELKLGACKEIRGFELGVATMKRGELSRFMIYPEYAFGKMGCPPRIPAEAQVMFEIELISFIDQSDLDNVLDMDETQRANATFDKILAATKNLKLEGNDAFKSGNIAKASAKYSRALRMLENARLGDEEDEEKMKSDAHILYMNLSMCDLKMKRSGRAAKYARKALEREPGNPRAIYRLAKAHHQLGEWDLAKKQFTKALKLEPNNRDIKQAITDLNQDIKNKKELDKNLMKKMMKIII
jgi:FK506-binding protein 6